MNKKWLSGAAALVSIGILVPGLSQGKTPSLNKVIQVTSVNNTDQAWGGKACVASAGLHCQTFALGRGQHVEETLPLPGAGRVSLSGYFTHLSVHGGAPVSCNTMFQVAGSDVMTGSIYVNQSSGTYTCQVVITQ